MKLLSLALLVILCGCQRRVISVPRQTQVRVTWWADDAIAYRYTDEDGAMYCGGVISGLPEGVYANGPGLPLHGQFFSSVSEARRMVEKYCLVSNQEQVFIEDQLAVEKFIFEEHP